MTTTRKHPQKKIDTIHIVHGMVELARSQKVSKLKVGDIEIEMHPDAFKTPPQAAKPKTAMQEKLLAEKKAIEDEELLYHSAE